MNHEMSNQGRDDVGAPAIGSDRRAFLAQMTGLAATAMGWSGTVSAADAPPPLPEIQLGPHRVSRLIVGSNPILGYSYMGPHTDEQMKQYFTTEKTIEFLRHCEECGITAHQFADPERALPYVRPLRESGSKMVFLCLHSDRDKVRGAVDLIRPHAMVHHGGLTDRLFADGKSETVHDYLKAAHDCGVLAGMSAHDPDCIRHAADAGWEVDFFMGCFYFLTRKTDDKAFEVRTLEFGYPFFRDDPKAMTQVMRGVKQPCLGFKILGAGRKCSSQQTVREAFDFAFRNIKPIDGVIVGMFPWTRDEAGADSQYTRELGRIG